MRPVRPCVVTLQGCLSSRREPARSDELAAEAEPVCVVSRPEPDDAEHISAVRLVSPGELRRMIAANEITNALTLALFARMAAKGSI